MKIDFDISRVRFRNNHIFSKGTILYWMRRDQRVYDNWALIYAYKIAIENQVPLRVVFNLYDSFKIVNLRHLDFMLHGLEEVSMDLEDLNIQFEVLTGDSVENIVNYISSNKIGFLITDFNPLRKPRIEVEKVLENIKIPLHEVDAHNIIPAWIVSDKKEYAAYTIRPKIHNKSTTYITKYPALFPLNKSKLKNPKNMINLLEKIRYDDSVKPNLNVLSGSKAANNVLSKFISERKSHYDNLRNDPNSDVQSNLSPYLHFGQISSQKIAYEISKNLTRDQILKDPFLEELIVRKELSDNYCYYEINYDSVKGFPNWAIKTLEKHKYDKRDFIYNLNQLENAETHDDLWNASQKQMTNLGKMHGYMRMYWAKKILEWTPDYKTALKYAIYLNDKYELDGRDPNGYAGIAWAIGGLHDRPWFEREIFGQIRYMNYNGCKSKFNVDKYIKTNE